MGWWTQARVNPDQGRCGVMITVGRQRCGAQVAAAGGVPAAGAASHCRMARSTASGWSSIGQCPASANSTYGHPSRSATRRQAAGGTMASFCPPMTRHLRPLSRG
eukprot:EG_transcript_36435